MSEAIKQVWMGNFLLDPKPDWEAHMYELSIRAAAEHLVIKLDDASYRDIDPSYTNAKLLGIYPAFIAQPCDSSTTCFQWSMANAIHKHWKSLPDIWRRAISESWKPDASDAYKLLRVSAEQMLVDGVLFDERFHSIAFIPITDWYVPPAGTLEQVEALFPPELRSQCCAA